MTVYLLSSRLEIPHVYVDSVVSMTAELDSCCLTEAKLCGYIDVNPLRHSRDLNVHTRREHGELVPFTGLLRNFNVCGFLLQAICGMTVVHECGLWVCN